MKVSSLMRLVLLLLSIVSAQSLIAQGPKQRLRSNPDPVKHTLAPVSCSPDKAAIEMGQAVIVRTWALPATGQQLTYTWTAQRGKIQGSGKEVTWNLTGAEAGAYRIRVRIRNSQVTVGECSVRVDVVAVDRGLRESGREFLLRGTTESAGYGLYSYLLFGSMPTSDNRNRYLKVINAYLDFLKISDLQATNNYTPQQLNITYLPLNTSKVDQIGASWLLDHYDFPRARSILSNLPGDRKNGIYFVSSVKPLTKGSSPPYLFQDLSNVPTSPNDLITWWAHEFLNQAAQEHFWNPRTRELLALRIRTTIAVLAEGLPDVKKSLDAWVSWIK